MKWDCIKYIFLLLVAIYGCSCSSNHETIIEVQSVSLSKREITMVSGETYTLSLTISPSNANCNEIEWFSRDDNIATVNNNGVVVARGSGTTVITAAVRSNGLWYYADCSVVVRNKAQHLMISGDVLHLIKGDNRPFSVQYYDGLRWNTGNGVKVIISDPSIVKYTDGQISALKKGDTEITFSIDDCSQVCKIKVFESWEEATPPDNEIWYKKDGSPIINGDIACNDYYIYIIETGKQALTLRETGVTKVILPNSVKLEEEMFEGCRSLVSFRINDGIKTIPQNCFEGCTSLSSILIPDTVSNIENEAFLDCSSLKKIVLKDNVITIGSGVFAGCSLLEQVELPSGLTVIPDYLFSDCKSLSSFSIPKSIRKIGERAFAGASLTKLEIPSNVKSIDEYAYEQCEELTEVYVPTGTQLGEGVFSSCKKLKTISLPSDLTDIPNLLLQSCSSLNSITLPSTVSSIGDDVFRNCSSLKSIVIPATVTRIGSYAFYKCTNLSYIQLLSSTPPSILSGSGVFDNTNDCPIRVPYASITSYKNKWREYASRITG